MSNPLGQTTRMGYDFGDLASITDPLGSVTNRLIDSAGRVINLTDAGGKATIYDFDP